jgi:hypothetical protein
MKAYVEATTNAAQACAAYVACTDDSAAPALWEAFEATQQRARACLARWIAARAGVDPARVIL